MDHAGHPGMMNMGGDGMTTTASSGGGGHEGHDLTGGTHGSYFVVQVVSIILFRQWKTTNWEELLGSCIAVGVVAVLYDGLKMFRDFLLVKQYTGNPKRSRLSVMCSGLHFLQTLLYMIQVLVSLCLMLVFMTFNVWLCLAVVVGAGIGYFLFGFRRVSASSMEDHCQ